MKAVWGALRIVVNWIILALFAWVVWNAILYH